MRLLLISPTTVPSTRGNAITARRMEVGLSRLGLAVEVASVAGAPSPASLEARPSADRPDVVHGLHAGQGGPAALERAAVLGVPCVVTLTGTDVNVEISDPVRRPIIVATLREASALVAFHESVARILRREVPEAASRLAVIPQAPYLVREPFGFRARFGYGPDDVILLLPGGIRPVKNNLFPVEALDSVAACDARLRLALAGPVIDATYFERLEGALARRPWARYLGDIPHEAMHAVLESVDLVLNCSLAEGGMANSVLEAEAVGTPVLVSGVEGNASLVEDGHTGATFETAADLAARVGRFLADPSGAREMAERARRRVLDLYPPERESEAYAQLYARLEPSGRRSGVGPRL